MKAERNKTSTISAPGKLLLLGDHAVVYGHPCIVTAVNYRVFVEVSSSEKDEFIFPEGTSTGFVTTALNVFRNNFSVRQHVKVKTWADYKESYGLGSSSAVTVAFIKAFSELFSQPLSKKELFDLCYEVVLKVQGVGSGFDIAAAIWGGTLYFITGGKKIQPIQIPNLPLVVAYSGLKGDTATLVKRVAKLREENPQMVNELFRKSEKLVTDGRELLEKRDDKSFGQLMNENHAILKKIDISTPKLDRLVEAALKAGAYGAKLSGAGGGDCMIALAPEEKRKDIEKALKQASGTILPIKTNEEGVRIEHATNN